MQTERIKVNNSGENLDRMLTEIEHYAENRRLAGKDALHLRLLAEETVTMIRQITGDFTGEMWVEDTEDECSITLEGEAKTNLDQREELLSVSSTGKNILAVGVMGKIREVLELSALGFEVVNQVEGLQSGMVYLSPGAMEMAAQTGMYPMWSLQAYRENVDEARDTDEQAAQAWDELEKSIVANIADDVQIGVRKNKVKMVVKLKLNR